MLSKTKAIVLKAIKYQEKSLIVTCYTQSHGVKTFFVPTAFSNRKSSQKIAYFQPLSILEIEADFRKKEGLTHFKNIRIDTPYYSISTSVFKNAIAILLSEVLNSALKETDQDTSLFEFLETALIWLDTHDEIANFHILVLLKITKFLGFYPDLQTDGYYFDVLNGTFSNEKNYNSLSETETTLFQKLIVLQFDSDQKIFNGQDRKHLLEILFKYYSLHIETFKRPKSLDILVDVFR